MVKFTKILQVVAGLLLMAGFLYAQEPAGYIRPASSEEFAGDQAEKEGHSREAVDHYVKALGEQSAATGLIPNDVDFRLRQKIITIVLRLNVPPAAPEQAERAIAVARAAQAEAKDESGYHKAIQKYEEASRSAPWLAVLYFNLGVLCDRDSNFARAANNFKLYLLAAPNAEDSQKVHDRIYLLEDKQKEKEAADVAAVKAQQADQAAALEARQAAIEAKLKDRVTFSLSAGMNSLKSNTIHWTEKDSFDREYKGITWEPGLHFGIELLVNSYSNPKGNSFVLGCGTIGAYFENNQSAASNATLTSTDLVTHIPTTVPSDLAEKSFTLTKISIGDKVTFGYRVMPSPIFAFEPYGGIGARGEFSSLVGTEIKDGWSAVGLCIDIPFGARIYIGHFYMGFEYNPNIVTWWGREFGTNYEDEKVVLSREGASSWAINIGGIW